MEEGTTAGALAGIRVVDFSTGPCGGQATTVLADFGADVLKVEPPGGDRFRSLASSPFWLRGKSTIELDLSTEAGRTSARELASAADVCVVSGPRNRLEQLGLDADAMRATHPQLIHCTISGFGDYAPDRCGYEGIVAAVAGRMDGFGVQLAEGRPVYAALPVATHMASQGALHGILAALLQRARTGQGDVVATSLLQGLMVFDLVDMLAWQLHTRDGSSFTPLRELTAMPTLNYHPLLTADRRWIQCGNLLEHLFMSFLDAIDLLGELLIDERFVGSPATWSPEAIEDARDRILMRMQERTANEWMDAFDANGNVAAEPIVTTAEALEHRDIATSLVEVEDPEVGVTTQIGPIARLESTPGRAVARRGAMSIADWSDGVASTSTTGNTSVVTGRPLDGVTILDLSTIIAGPLGMSMLADLGARVIKVEPFAGDPFRQLLVEGRMAVKTNAGKESICIDLKTEDGQALLHRMVAEADVLMHNFRGPVPAKLGIDPDTLQAINPRLIWAALSGYSAASPSALRPATHPVIGAASGGVAYQAGPALTAPCATLQDVRETARRIMSANEANPDPNTSVVAASAILLALLVRGDSGPGQVVRIDMQTANAWANGDDFLSYTGKPDRIAVDDALLGLGPRYRLYATADGWIFLAAPTDRDLERFGAEIDRADLATKHDDELIGELEALFRSKPTEHWTALADRGIGIARADGIDSGIRWADDPRITAAGWAPEVDHARFGSVRRWGPLTTVGGAASDFPEHYRPAPLAGEHTDTLLAEFGYTDREIVALRKDRIVNSEPTDAVQPVPAQSNDPVEAP
ncbi:MAG: CoA transferase [Actinomycetota bacterium]